MHGPQTLSWPAVLTGSLIATMLVAVSQTWAGVRAGGSRGEGPDV